MPPGDCEILRPFCCPADGAAMGAAAPGHAAQQTKRTDTTQAGGGQGAGGRASALPAFGGFGTPSMRVPRGLAAISAHFGRACRPSLSGRACRPAPCALPSPCLRGVCPFRLLGSMPGRGCSHGCAWLAYLRSFRFLLANTRFSAICNNF